MKDIIDPPGINRSVNALAELAGRINAEHAEALTAARASLMHARNAGILMVEAKKQCGHGQWLGWIKENVKFFERTAQAYMRVAKRWPELEAKAQATADLTIEDGLRLLAAPSTDEEANPQLPADLADDTLDGAPAALAYYHGAGLIDQQSLDLFLGLEEEYGPEIVTRFKDKKDTLDPDTPVRCTSPSARWPGR